MRRGVILLAAAALVAGCGDDDGGDKATTTAVQVDEAVGDVRLVDAPGPPADAAKIGRQCNLGAPAQDAKVRVPEGLLPDGAFAMRDEKLVFRSTLREAYGAMLAKAEAMGLTIERKELEGVDAELELETAEGVLRFGYGPAGLCKDVSQAAVILGRE